MTTYEIEPGRSTIHTLSDDVLLCIFDSHRQGYDRSGKYVQYDGLGIWPWQTLVHVCRRWRRIVFEYPRYLNLRLECKSKRDVRAKLDVWPVLPLSIYALFGPKFANEDDIIGALEHRDLVAAIHIWAFHWTPLEKMIASMMQGTFPVLTSLLLVADGMMFPITDDFLVGTAPRLQCIYLHGVEFPGLPKLLSSTNDLVRLTLENFPMTGEGHIDTITTCLSVLTKLQRLTICFLRERPPSLYPTDQRLPPATHTVLPSLTYLWLAGPHEYLQDLVARVDAPLVNNGGLGFHDEPIHFTPQVPQFIHRTEAFKLLGNVKVDFHRKCVLNREGILASFRPLIGPAKFDLSFPCSRLPAHFANMERFCAQWPPLVSHVELLELGDEFFEEEKLYQWEVITPWLGFLRYFSAVRTLYLHVTVQVHHVVHILGELEGERAIEVLPTLRTIELVCSNGGPGSETLRLLGPFLVAREELEHPVVVNVVPES